MSNKTTIITGGSSGLGLAIKRHLEDIEGHQVFDWSLETGVDVTDEFGIQIAANNVFAQCANGVDHLINCAGVNHIEFLPKLHAADWDRLMDTNAKGIFLTAKTLCDHMRGGTILNIVSNASHMPMTSSAAYNASKGAAAILTKQLSRELIKTHGITVFAISPNKLKNTGMTAYIDKKVQELRGWTEEEARAYQIASLPAGEETDPKTLAEFIGFLLSTKERHKFLAGVDIPYGL